MKSISILLTDPDSINELLLLKSYKFLKKCRLKKIYFVGDKNLFNKIFYKFNNNQKFEFIHIDYNNNCTIYLKKTIKISTELFNNKKISYVINLPLNKKKFFKNQYNGFTEFFSKTLDNKKDENMLLFNKNFSVCPLTTHIEIKKVESQINKDKLVKTIKNLSYSETALLAALPKAPSKYNPYKFPDLAKFRRNLVLQNLAENNFISKKNLEKLKESKLILKKRKIEIVNEANSYTEEVRRLVKNIYGFEKLYSQGLSISTPLNINYQIY